MSTATAVTQTLLYASSTALQFAVGLSWREQDAPWFPCIVGGLLISQMLLTVSSLVWIYKKMDFQGSVLSEATCVLAHLLQLGPIWRCLKVAITRDPKDVTELNTLYLALALIRDAPFVVLQVFLMVQGRETVTPLGLVSVVLTFLAVCAAHTCATVGPSKGAAPSTSGEGLGRLKECVCSILHVVYRALVLASRCLAFGLFADAARWWVFLIVGLHLSIHWSMTVILRTARKDSGRNNNSILGQTLHSSVASRYHLLSLLEVFDLVNMRDQQRRDTLESITFYCIVALQNATMAVLWFLKSGFSVTNTALFGTVLATFLLGASVCLLRLSCTRRVHRVVTREAAAAVTVAVSRNASPLSTKSTDVLMKGPVIQADTHTHLAVMVSLTETFQNVYDNKSFDAIDCEISRSARSPTSLRVPSPQRGTIDPVALRPWNKHRAVEGLTYSDWKRCVLEPAAAYPRLPNTQVPHPCGPGCLSKTESSPEGGAVPHSQQDIVAASDDSALDKSCASNADSAVHVPSNPETHRLPSQECRDCCPEEKLASRRAGDSKFATPKGNPTVSVLSTPRHGWGVDSVSCTTCSTAVRRRPAPDGCYPHYSRTYCSRTNCSQCDCSASSSSGGETGADWATNYCREDTSTWTGTWPPRRKLALDNVSALARHPVSTEHHVRKWLEEIETATAAASSVSQTAAVQMPDADDSPLPRYPVHMLDRLADRQPPHVTIRTDSYVEARNVPAGPNRTDLYSRTGPGHGEARQPLHKLKDLLSKLCRAQNSALCDELRKRRYTISGAEIKAMAKAARARQLEAQESVI